MTPARSPSAVLFNSNVGWLILTRIIGVSTLEVDALS